MANMIELFLSEIFVYATIALDDIMSLSEGSKALNKTAKKKKTTQK